MEKKGASSELDYLITDGPLLIPVEGKAGKTGSLRSLHTFAALKKTKFALRLNGDLPSITDVKTTIEYIGEADYKLMSLPLYMVGQFNRLLHSKDIF